MNISVVIPVYNVEDYLHYAIDSLVNQTQENYVINMLKNMIGLGYFIKRMVVYQMHVIMEC